ncbi:hypothetical protein DFS34DRAFT_48694 [Phlyctochytrium arcticum]|nr:hypothetical protein DFS34DRAFT_48694 [Phlyctochytrium arcticum]
MLLKAKDALNQTQVALFVVSTLHVLQRLPVQLDDLREMKTGRVVKYFSTANCGDGPEAKRNTTMINDAAGRVMKRWQALISRSATEDKDKTEKKRVREEAGGTSSGKKAKVAAEKTDKKVEDRKVVAAVDNFDIFKSLSHAALPKIKKSEKSSESRETPPPSTQGVSNTSRESTKRADSTIFQPLTQPKASMPTSTSSLLIDAASIPSYRDTSLPLPTSSTTTSRDGNSSKQETPDSGNTRQKKRVRFASDDKLVAIRYIEKHHPNQHEQEEEFAMTPHVRGNARDFDRQEGHRAFRSAPSSRPPVDVVASKEWHVPRLISSPQRYEWAKESVEMDVQQDRVRGILSVTYFTEDQIPYSPAEPDENAWIGDGADTKRIPVEDQMSALPSNPADLLSLAAGTSLGGGGSLPMDLTSLLSALNPSAPAAAAAPPMDLGATLLSALGGQQSSGLDANALLLQTLLSQLGAGAGQQSQNDQQQQQNSLAALLSLAQQQQPPQNSNQQQQHSQYGNVSDPPRQERESRWGPSNTASNAPSNQGNFTGTGPNRNNPPGRPQRSHPYDRPQRGRGGTQHGRGGGRNPGPPPPPGTGTPPHPAVRGTKSCYFFAQGFCKNGAKCTFRHDGQFPPPVPARDGTMGPPMQH